MSLATFVQYVLRPTENVPLFDVIHNMVGQPVKYMANTRGSTTSNDIWKAQYYSFLLLRYLYERSSTHETCIGRDYEDR
jgi:hypothetical protein